MKRLSSIAPGGPHPRTRVQHVQRCCSPRFSNHGTIGPATFGGTSDARARHWSPVLNKSSIRSTTMTTLAASESDTSLDTFVLLEGGFFHFRTSATRC